MSMKQIEESQTITIASRVKNNFKTIYMNKNVDRTIYSPIRKGFSEDD